MRMVDRRVKPRARRFSAWNSPSIGHHTQHAGRRDRVDECGVLRRQRRDTGAEALDALGELRISQRMGQFIEQHRAGEEIDLTVDGRLQQPPRRPVPKQPGDHDIRIEHQPQRGLRLLR